MLVLECSDGFWYWSLQLQSLWFIGKTPFVNKRNFRWESYQYKDVLKCIDNLYQCPIDVTVWASKKKLRMQLHWCTREEYAQRTIGFWWSKMPTLFLIQVMYEWIQWCESTTISVSVFFIPKPQYTCALHTRFYHNRLICYKWKHQNVFTSALPCLS